MKDVEQKKKQANRFETREQREQVRKRVTIKTKKQKEQKKVRRVIYDETTRTKVIEKVKEFF
jgi:hypothetical protein